MIRPSTIVLTGAAGIVGTALRPILAREFRQVVLTDVEKISDLAPNECFRQGDIADLDFVKKIANGADGIVHLAGKVGAQFTFDDVLGPNIAGTHHVFETARQCGISHVVSASSHHAVGFIQRGAPIDHTTAHRPDTEYGLSKAFGESAAAYFADKFGLNVLSIRIGYVGPDIPDERRLHTWISAHDLAQLIEIGLTTPNLGHEIVYGVSQVDEPFFDNSNAFRLGYQPQDRARDAVADPSILEIAPNLDTIEEGVVGGGFAAADFAGDASRILKSSSKS